MAFETAEGTPFLSYGELVTLTKNLRGSSAGAGLAEIFYGERLTNSEAQAALEAARMDAQGSEEAHRIIDEGVARLRAAEVAPPDGELTAGDSHDQDDDEEAVEIAPPLRAMGGTVVLDDPSSYADPARFIGECFRAWLTEGGGEVSQQDCLIDFNLWIYDAGDPEEGNEWELLIGPLTKADVGQLDDSRTTWLVNTMMQAFQTASERLNDTFLVENPGSLLETEVVVRFLPPKAAC